jgi:hypothetical protein
MFLWMLPAIESEPHRHVALARNVRCAIVQDIERYSPDLILIERGPVNGLNADPLNFVVSDPAIRSQLARYHENPSIGALAVFRKKAVDPASTRSKRTHDQARDSCFSSS